MLKALPTMKTIRAEIGLTQRTMAEVLSTRLNDPTYKRTDYSNLENGLRTADPLEAQTISLILQASIPGIFYSDQA